MQFVSALAKYERFIRIRMRCAHSFGTFSVLYVPFYFRQRIVFRPINNRSPAEPNER